jgi:hypothetical protein
MLDIKNRPRDSSKTDKLESLDAASSTDSPQESRSGLVIVIGVVALTSMIFGFILGRLI